MGYGEGRDERIVWTMGEDDVDVGLLETRERALETFDDVLFREAAGVWFLATCTEEDFGDENVFVSRPSQLFKCSAHFDFALAVRIDLGRVSLVQLRRDGDFVTSAVSKQLTPWSQAACMHSLTIFPFCVPP